MADDEQSPPKRGRRRDTPDRRLKREAGDVKQFVRSLKAHELDDAEEALRDLRHELRGEVLGADSYVPVFLLTLAIVVLIPLSDGNLWVQIPLTFLATGTMLLTVRRSHIRPVSLRRLSALALLAGALALAATIGSHVSNDHPVLASLSALLFGFLVAMSIPAMLRRVLLAPRVTLNTLCGALAAYLLLGLFFSSSFRFVATANPNPDSHFFAQRTNPGVSDFEYFSFITITTVGYGDLTPGNDIARAGAVSEAVLGQVFMVTIVARLVSHLGTQRLPIGSVTEGRRPEPLDEQPPDRDTPTDD